MQKRSKFLLILLILYLTYFALIINPLSPYFRYMTFQWRLYQNYQFIQHSVYDGDKIESICDIYSLDNNKMTVYNCSNNTNNIGIVSFHFYGDNTDKSLSYENFILSNHIEYTMRNRYIYFDVHELIYDNQAWLEYFNDTTIAFKAQKPFIIEFIFSYFRSEQLSYLLWLDFDAVFYNGNCQTLSKIENIISYTHQLYDKHNKISTKSIIFSRDDVSLANTGVVIYKKNNFTQYFIKLQVNILKYVGNNVFSFLGISLCF